ncbi:MAG: PIG-L family deacetylase, partial [Phycisphaeraceae bacterium]|nr:PIG-L family deacetylase [Phycisphaeraceae bacterium]
MLLLTACHGGPAPNQGLSDRVRTDADPAAPRVLVVVAHPDDETTFAATIYKTAVHDGGSVDAVVVTNGEGGFKYATLAERLYGAELTDEAVGRRRLPAIRRREFLAGAEIMGIDSTWFLDQTDSRYSLDPQEVLDPVHGAWDVPKVRRSLRSILQGGRYDFVLTMLPHPRTHGHHKAATMLALETVAAMPPDRRPVVLAGTTRDKDEGRVAFRRLKGHPLTEIDTEAGPWVFDRTRRFGHRNRLNYQIVVNWVIAEHKSQGTMQLAMNRGQAEAFYLYTLNGPEAP